MKNLRLATFVVFALSAFCLPAQAQKKWTYKWEHSSSEGPPFEITVIITQRPSGYEMSGEYRIANYSFCKIRGSYLPAGRRLRGLCVLPDGSERQITGSKLASEDALKFTLDKDVFVAERVASKSTATSVDDAGGGRVKFQRGSSAAVLKGPVVRGTQDRHVLGARAGQTMTVHVASEGNNAVFQINQPNGQALPGAGERDDATNWSGQMPSSGDYVIVVAPTRGNATYTLRVTIQ